MTPTRAEVAAETLRWSLGLTGSGAVLSQIDHARAAAALATLTAALEGHSEVLADQRRRLGAEADEWREKFKGAVACATKQEAALEAAERNLALYAASDSLVQDQPGIKALLERAEQAEAALEAHRELCAYLLPVVEGQLATRSLEQQVNSHHEVCERCSTRIGATCTELDRLCDLVEMAAGQYEADLAKWEISDRRALLGGQ